MWWVGQSLWKDLLGTPTRSSGCDSWAPYLSAQSLGSLLGTEGTMTTPQLQQSVDLSWELWK